MVSIRLATATAVLLALAGCTASAAVVAEAVVAAPQQAPPAPLAGCRESSFTEGVCTFKVTVCSFRTTVCCSTPPPSSRHVCETDSTFTEAYELVKEHGIPCFPETTAAAEVKADSTA